MRRAESTARMSNEDRRRALNYTPALNGSDDEISTHLVCETRVRFRVIKFDRCRERIPRRIE